MVHIFMAVPKVMCLQLFQETGSLGVWVGKPEDMRAVASRVPEACELKADLLTHSIS